MDHRTPPELVDQRAQLIAYATTDDGARDFWTELAVWYLHAPKPGSRPWFVRVSGMTRVEGKLPRHAGLASGTLERALKMIDQTSEVGILVAETAREWAEENRVTIENGRGQPVQFDSDDAALAWLYGKPEGDRGLVSSLARDTGTGESTIRMQLKRDRPVMVPLRALLPFIDRNAWRAANGGDRG